MIASKEKVQVRGAMNSASAWTRVGAVDASVSPTRSRLGGGCGTTTHLAL